MLINFLVVLFSLFIEIHFCFPGLSHFFFLYVSQFFLCFLGLLPNVNFPFHSLPLVFLLSDASSCDAKTCFFFFLINSGFESLPFPVYLLFYPFYHDPSNLPLLLNVLSLLQVFLKLHLLLLLLFMHSI